MLLIIILCKTILSYYVHTIYKSRKQLKIQVLEDVCEAGKMNALWILASVWQGVFGETLPEMLEMFFYFPVYHQNCVIVLAL